MNKDFRFREKLCVNHPGRCINEPCRVVGNDFEVCSNCFAEERTQSDGLCATCATYIETESNAPDFVHAAIFLDYLHERADALWNRGESTTSWQVLNNLSEYLHEAVRAPGGKVRHY